MRKIVSMRQAREDPALLGGILAGNTLAPWRTILIAALGERLNRHERRVFKKFTGRDYEPGKVVEVLACLIGRRGRKSRAASALAVYFSALCDYSDIVAPGERLKVLFLARSQRQATVVYNYVCGVFDSVPMLRKLIANRTQESLQLTTQIDCEIMAANAATVRGVSCAAVIADEACHWVTAEESQNADSLILNAARPSLATTNGMMVIISSVYGRRGETYRLWERHYGPAGDPLTLISFMARRRISIPYYRSQSLTARWT
jgi:hypothetical protein